MCAKKANRQVSHVAIGSSVVGPVVKKLVTVASHTQDVPQNSPSYKSPHAKCPRVRATEAHWTTVQATRASAPSARPPSEFDNDCSPAGQRRPPRVTRTLVKCAAARRAKVPTSSGRREVGRKTGAAAWRSDGKTRARPAVGTCAVPRRVLRKERKARKKFCVAGGEENLRPLLGTLPRTRRAGLTSSRACLFATLQRRVNQGPSHKADGLRKPLLASDAQHKRVLVPRARHRRVRLAVHLNLLNCHDVRLAHLDGQRHVARANSRML